ncbi:sulfotransferase, putative, partial [Entamoeba invadens IP1]
MLHTNPFTYSVDTTNKYGLPLIPDEHWEPLFAELGKQSIGLLMQLDPTHAELYQKEIPQTFNDIPKQFKDAMHEMMAGCFDQKSKLFEMMTRNVIVKYASYLRFLMERRLYKEKLESTDLLPSLFVLALPRSGSTFLHTILSSNALAETMAMYEHLAPGPFTMTSQSRKNFGNQLVSTVHSHTSTLNEVHVLKSAEQAEEELFFLETLGHSYLFPNAVPRYEMYRKGMFERNYEFAYDQLKDHMKMHQLEFLVPAQTL